jgi:hypothetical protein
VCVGGGCGSRGIAQRYKGVVVKAIPWPLYPQERSKVTIFVQETAWTTGAIGTVAENLPPNGAVCGPWQDFNPTSSNLRPSHYNDHVIVAPTTDMVWIFTLF